MEKLTKIWKQFIITLSSVMLLNMSFVYNVEGLRFSFSNSAYAQDTKVNKGSSGTIKTEEADGNFLAGEVVSTVVFLAAAFFISKLLILMKPKTPNDVIGAAIAGGIYIAAEAMEMMEAKEKLKGKDIDYKTRDEDGAIDDEQYRALAAEKSALEQVKSTASRKIDFLKAVTAAFGVSSIIAFNGDANLKGAAKNCSAAMTKAAASIEASASISSRAIQVISRGVSPGMAALNADFTEAASLAKSVITSVQTTENIRELTPWSSNKKGPKIEAMNKTIFSESTLCLASSDKSLADYNSAYQNAYSITVNQRNIACDTAATGASAALCADLNRSIFSGGALDSTAQQKLAEQKASVQNARNACQLYTGNLTQATGYILNIDNVVLLPAKDSGLKLSSFMNLLIQKAEASSSSGLIGIIIGIISAIYVDVGSYLDTFIVEPSYRAWMWFALGAYAEAVRREIEKSKVEAERGIAEIKKIMRKMDRSRLTVEMDTSVVRNSMSRTQMISISAISFPSGETLPCLVGSSSGKCPVNAFSTNASMINSNDMPNLVRSGMSELLTIGDGISGANSISTETISAVESFGGKAEAFKNLNDKIQKKVIDKLNKSGSSGFTAGKLIKNITDGLNNASKGKKGNLPSLAYSRGGIAPDLMDSNDKKEKGMLVAPLKVDTPRNNINSGNGLESKKSGFDFDFSTSEDTNSIIAAKNEEFNANAQAANANTEIKDDIIQDKSVSIFKVISIRYKKSGFKRLLDEL